MKTFYENDPITVLKETYITPGQAENERGREIKNNYVSFGLFGMVAAGLVAAGYFSSSYTESVFGAILIVILTLGLIQTLIQRSVANMMNTSATGLAGKETADQLIEKDPLDVDGAGIVPAFQLDVYEQNELPDHDYLLNQQLTEGKNVFNRKPLQIFYFFNFYSGGSLINKVSGGFQRHGPLFFLGSPQDIGFGKLWNMFSIKKMVTRLLITSPEKLSEAINKVSTQPLPPKTKGLVAEYYYTGAYPANVFYCTDVIWKQCVTLLFEKTDFSIIDANDYTSERAGLQWEIGQIINHIATEDFVVLINSKTDIISLGESFKNSWKNMRANSPNRKINAAPVRFVFSQVTDHKIGEKAHTNIFLERYRQRALSNDNIIAFMLQSKNDFKP